MANFSLVDKNILPRITVKSDRDVRSVMVKLKRMHMVEAEAQVLMLRKAKLEQKKSTKRAQKGWLKLLQTLSRLQTLSCALVEDRERLKL